MAYIALSGVTKEYVMGEVTIHALSGVDFQLEKGELCVVVGPSGAGKTTLLNILGGMDSCTSGEIVVDGEHIEQYSNRQLTRYRRETVGFVFQFYNLVQNLTALENVELASQICKDPRPAKDTLIGVGLGERLTNFPAQLSGGEQQMLAIARGLMSDPKLLLLDEPSLGLAPLIVNEVINIIQQINKEGITVLLVEQNARKALKIADHACVIQQGRIVRYGTGAEILQEENFLSSYLGNSKQVKQED